MKKTIFVIFTVLITATIFGGIARGDDFCATPAETGQGLFKGFTDPDYAACVYRGIPFAQPPVGERRWRRPEPPAKHQGVFEATKFGPACIQKESILNGGKADYYSEDCLYLNVWRPAKPGKFPVMVWIYGGSFAGGAGSFDIYDGAHLASRQDVVVVTLNYRLGVFGFFALPELKAEDPKGSTGNYGILDQMRALEWVRDNIAAFGGDPDNVTVFGQSAGGMSICTLMASPEAKGLFHRAMIMSGPCRMETNLEDAYAKSRKVVGNLGCEGANILSCSRSRSPHDLEKKPGNDLYSGGMAWSPAVDGAVLPDSPVKLIQQGKYNSVPMIIGSTRDELRIYTMTVPGLGLWSKGTVKRFMKSLTGINADKILSLYKFSDYRRPIDLAFAFGKDIAFDTPLFMMAEATAAKNPVYIYQFDWDQTRLPHKLGAFHAIDVPFVFGALNPDAQIAKLLASKKTYEKNQYLAYIMMDYITNFARSGNPNGKDAPPWPAYTPEKRERLYFNSKIASRPLSDREVTRLRWYSERRMEDILTGPISRSISKKKQ